MGAERERVAGFGRLEDPAAVRRRRIGRHHRHAARGRPGSQGDQRGRGVLDEAIALLAEGRLRLRANQAMPMQQAAEAHRQLESGTVRERIILTLE